MTTSWELQSFLFRIAKFPFPTLLQAGQCSEEGSVWFSDSDSHGEKTFFDSFHMNIPPSLLTHFHFCNESILETLVAKGYRLCNSWFSQTFGLILERQNARFWSGQLPSSLKDLYFFRRFHVFNKYVSRLFFDFSQFEPQYAVV